MKFTSIQLTAQPSDDEPRALALRSYPGAGLFMRESRAELFSSNCSFFLFFTSTSGRHCTLSHKLAASLKQPTRNAPSWRRGLVEKEASLGPAGERRGAFFRARSDARRTQGNLGGGSSS
jgi:hypothetical protein